MHFIRKSDVKFGSPHLLTGVLAFVLFFFYTGYEKSQSDPGVILKQVQREYLAMEIVSDQLLKKLIGEFNTRKREQGVFFFGAAPKFVIPSGYTLLVTKGDSLLYWSDNSIPLPEGSLGPVRVNPYIAKYKNGWYRVSYEQRGDHYFWCMLLLQHQYAFQNDYLKNGFNDQFGIPEWVGLSTDVKGYTVVSGKGTPMFALTFGTEIEPQPLSEGLKLILILFGLLGFALFIYRLFGSTAWLSANPRIFVLVYLAALVILRCLQYWLHFPSALYNTTLFGPTLHSTSFLLPSLGDFVINSVLLIVMAYCYFRYWPVSSTNYKGKDLISIGSTLGSVLFMLTSFLCAALLIRSLVLNSTFPLNFKDISNFTTGSIWGVIVICSVLLSLFLITGRILSAFFDKGPAIPAVLFLLFLLSVFATIVLNSANKYKENEKRKVLAMQLSGRRNPITEVLYDKLERKIWADSVVRTKATSDTLAEYLERTFLTDYWSKFNIQVTVCTLGKTLKVQPQGYEVDCRSYFQNLISSFGEATPMSNLYFLDYGSGNENYLATIALLGTDSVSTPETKVYIEFNAKTAYKDLGYPELLMDKDRTGIPDIADYSYGLYREGRLVHAVGSCPYGMEMTPPADTSGQGVFLTDYGMDHYYYRINRDNVLVVSRAQSNLLDIITPLSYLFILLALLTLFFYSLFNFSELARRSHLTLKDRLQVLMIGTLLVSFIVVGFISGYNIIRLNSVKNEINLRERSVSVLVEMQHKYGHTGSLWEVAGADLNNLLVKFANVFFSDINIFDSQGRIVGSSRPQIFEEGLVSDRINSSAYYRLAIEKQASVIQEESIGGLTYNSAYLPFFNDNGNLLGYLNLPYFTRQDELKKEMSAFLVTVVNIYVLLVLSGIIIIFFIARYITSPLSMLAGKLARLQLGGNEKIYWKRGDEIGKLVEEYNRMIDELERNAEKLARSEREGAWREMARQVAHEIKNPLTPMKLSIQYMQKIWADQAPDREQRLERFSKTLIEQIDTLSAIATEFSDFAKRTEPVRERVDLVEAVRSAVSLYAELENIAVVYEPEVPNAFIFADRKQLQRAFTNLLNNAVQAIGEKPEGRIYIRLTKEQTLYVVAITDNGEGIPPMQMSRIFQPNFTTKSGGMGLGLAIVKEIVQNMDGDITFATPEAGGSVFIISLPSLPEQI